MTPGTDLIKGLTILHTGAGPLSDQTMDVLRRLEARVVSAHTPSRALYLLGGTPNPDMALLDIDADLPADGQGGAPAPPLELAGRIRERRPELPIILAGSDPDRDSLLKAISIGATRFVTKPMREAELIEALALSAAGSIQQRAADKDYALTRRILDHSPDYVIITDGERVDFVNRPLLDMVGCDHCQDVPTCDALEMKLVLARKESVSDCAEFAAWLRTAIGDPAREHIVFLSNGDGKRTFLLRAKRLDDPLTGKFLVSFTDITSIEQERQHYHELAIKDPLTKAYNRMKFGDEMAREQARAVRYGTPLSLVMLDLDDFKRVNDQFGHQAGDMVLVELVGLVRRKLRIIDILARWGGEEFFVILPQTDLQGAAITADKLRRAVAEHAFGDLPRVTCSLGAGELAPGEGADSLIRRVDSALYQAKSLGKNLVVQALPPKGEAA